MLRVRTEADLLQIGMSPSAIETTGKPKTRAKHSPDYEQLFADQCRMFKLPEPEREYRFAKDSPQFKSETGKPRQWRFDFAWPQYKLSLEIEGVVVRKVWVAKFEGTRPYQSGKYVANVLECKPTVVTMGGHADVQGQRLRFLKYNAATRLGWFRLQFLQEDIANRNAINETMQTLYALGWKGPGHGG